MQAEDDRHQDCVQEWEVCVDKRPILLAMYEAQVRGGCKGGSHAARLEVSSLQEYLQLFYLSRSQEDLRIGLKMYPVCPSFCFFNDLGP